MTAEVEPSQPSSPHTRRRLRVTTGCKTCRKRHVKCDERKPTCMNCGKKNRPCRYDSPSDTSEPSTRRPSQTPGPAEFPATTSEINDAGPANETENAESQALRDPIVDPIVEPIVDPVVSPQPTRNDSQALEQPPLSAYSPISPFSATLESILLQAGIDTEKNRFPDGATQDAVANVHAPSYLDQSFGEFQGFQPISNAFHESHVQLSDSEIGIFRNYVENVSKWVDSFSHDQPFHRLIPILALRCPFLLYSCLALSSKQMVLIGIGIHESTAVRYYRLALKGVSSQLLDPQNAYRDEVLAACIILSTYEMIDVVGESLGPHLRGVASLLQSRQICGSAFGIRGSCYWTWYRHEIWASLQTGRCMSLDERYWQPPQLDSFEGLTIETIANRVIFIFGQCINFCNDDDRGSMNRDELLQARHAKAAELESALNEWKAKLPLSMSSFPAGYAAADSASEFPSQWFIFPQSAIAHQVYHASKIILALHRPTPVPEARGLGNLASLSLRRDIEVSREQIFLTANSGIPDAWSLVSVQCLYIAGLVTEGAQERKRTLELIDQCQKRSGRKTSFIADELRRLWEYSQVPTF